MKINHVIVVMVAIAVLVLIIFIIRRNKKYEEQFEQEVINSEPDLEKDDRENI